MKRILLSGTIALCVHIAFFLSIPLLIQKNHKPAKPEIKSVMVTMSYRPLEEKKEKIKRMPVKRIVKKKITKPKPKKKIKPKNKPLPALEPEPEPFQKPDLISLPETDIKQEIAENQVKNKKSPTFQEKETPYRNNKTVTITEPFYKKNPLPKYPTKAKRRGHEGIVELMVQVSEKGKVSNLWIFKSSNYKSLDNQAVKIVKQWIFEPGKKNGKPEKMWVKIPIKFKLKS